MDRLLLKRHPGFALSYLLLEMAALHTATMMPADYQTIDGEMVSYSIGEAALRNGSAVLVGGLLVGVLPLVAEVEKV
ncbi:hypothetical protein [Hymenobacter cavernae]|uniref:Uncharacterized protein n=1 Tax=Hymenobacter cavernae TaxID=2044852 RepID=A0ABQ1TJ76_9BACT|nr:hypothetical protein [Hymenobacter cavernae]GGE96407.1 hypothetical protein GCM10011383_03950 [Hymenobacter cavernae]